MKRETEKQKVVVKNFEEYQEKILNDRAMRRAITGQSHWWFFHIFLGHYVRCRTSPFHEEMFKLSEKEIKLLAVMAFRGSGKSTILNTSLTLWSILGVLQKKCVLIVSRTPELAASHIRDIKQELEHNALLRTDLGPFTEEGDKLGVRSLLLSRMNARITGIGREQSLRGMKHGQFRPDLIICDDLEDSSSVENKDERDATYNWFKNEVVPAGDLNTQIVVLGNLLHKDSLLMRLRDQIEDGEIDGIFRAYPFVDNNNKPLWPGKFPTKYEVEKLRAEIADEKVWKQEYLLVLPYDSSYDTVPERIVLRQQFVKIVEKWRRESGRRIYSPHLRRMGYRISAPYGWEIDRLGERLEELQRAEERRIYEMRDKSKDPPRLRPPGYEPPEEKPNGYTGNDPHLQELQRYFDEVAKKAISDQAAWERGRKDREEEEVLKRINDQARAEDQDLMKKYMGY